jgi:hypothetical protein
MANDQHVALLPLPFFLARRVWNGIFVAGDRRGKRDLITMSPFSDRTSETTTCEKWPQKRPFCLRAIYCGLDWAHQGSNLGPTG